MWTVQVTATAMRAGESATDGNPVWTFKVTRQSHTPFGPLAVPDVNDIPADIRDGLRAWLDGADKR
jgi:hypothetical protein